MDIIIVFRIVIVSAYHNITSFPTSDTNFSIPDYYTMKQTDLQAAYSQNYGCSTALAVIDFA
jgi:hypothetical protein